VEAEGPIPHAESGPTWRIVRYEFAGGLKLTWYDGGKRPPEELALGAKLPDQGSLVVGEKGTLLLMHSRGHKLLPESKFAEFKGPETTIARPPGGDHHGDWIRAIKTGGQAGSHFAYAAALTEIPHTGNVAYRAGAMLEWDSANLKARNCPEADRYIRREYRKRWSL